MQALPLFQQLTYTGLEPMLAFDVVYGGHFEHRLLAARRSTMLHQRLVVGDTILETGAYDFPVVACGGMPHNMVCLGLMADGIETTRCNALVMREDEIQIYPSGVDLLYHATANSRWVNLIVAEQVLQETALSVTGRPLDLPRQHSVSIRLPPRSSRSLIQATDDAFDIGRAFENSGMSAELANGISRGLITAYVKALSSANLTREREKSATNQRSFHLMLACERLAMSRELTDVDLDDIARRSGYSRRALELIFNQTVGMPPGRWFRNVRLNGALRDLLQPTPGCTVSDVAIRWGFRHVARFAERYRESFGELPSRTLARAVDR